MKNERLRELRVDRVDKVDKVDGLSVIHHKKENERLKESKAGRCVLNSLKKEIRNSIH